MKPAIRALLDDGHPGVDRRSFCKRLGIGAGAAIAMTGEAAAAAAADLYSRTSIARPNRRR